MRVLKGTLAAACAALLIAAPAAPAFEGPDGRLTQLNAGPQVARGCITDDGSSPAGPGTCTDGRALGSPTAAGTVISPDGAQVYAVGDDGIAVMQRDSSTGELFQSSGSDGCFNLLGSAEGFPCGALPGFAGTYGIAISPDGTNVYATSLTNDAVFSFARNPLNGALSPVGALADACVAHSPGGPTAGCTDVRALNAPHEIAVSPDGANVYVTSQDSDAVAAFSRGGGGKLTQLGGAAGCVSDNGEDESGIPGSCGEAGGLTASAAMPLALSGGNAYIGANDTLNGFGRAGGGALVPSQCFDGGAGPPAPPCAAAVGLEDVADLAVTPNGAHLYAVSSGENALSHFTRDANGALAPSSCQSEGGSSCAFQGVAAMIAPAGLAITPNGASLYVASGVGGAQSKAIASFALDPASGAVGQLPGAAACTSETPGAPAGTAQCTNGKALEGATGVVVTPDSNYVYSVAVSPTDGIAAFVRTDPPETTITAGPGRRTKRRRSLFQFTADEAGAGFSCKLDKKPFKVCKKAAFKTRRLRRGTRHTFQVFAADASGQIDPTPALRRFKVISRGRIKVLAKRHAKSKRRGPEGNEPAAKKPQR